jgi:hypothetical protein
MMTGCTATRDRGCSVFRRAGKAEINSSGGRRLQLSPEQENELQSRLAVLQEEHRDLDAAIAALAEQVVTDQLQLQRLKKRKLHLKDQIIRINDQLLPDIIA